MTARTGAAVHALAAGLGVSAAGGCLCAVCGPSPFAEAGATRKVLGAGWSEFGVMADRSGAVVCAGCARLMSGRPGDDPPPPRTRSLAVLGETVRMLDFAGMWELLRDPPEDLMVLSWAISGQKHHWIHAGWSTPDRLVVGSDDGPISVDVYATRSMVSALVDFRSGPKSKARVSREEILTGHYRPATIAALGARRWAAGEAAIAPWRGLPVLRLYVGHCPVADDPTSSTETTMVDPLDTRIAEALVVLAEASQWRQRDPITFWSTYFLRRVQRHAHRDLAPFFARLMQDLEVTPSGPVAELVAATLGDLDAASQRAFMARLQGTAPVLVALAYDRRQRAKVARAAQKAA